MDSDYIPFIGIVIWIMMAIILIGIEVIAVILVAGAIASWLGVTGILWWAVAIVVFILINALIGALWGLAR